MVIIRIIDDGNRQPAESQIHRSVMLISRLHRSFGLHGIGRTDHSHSRYRPHQRYILVALVGGSVLSHGNPGMGRRNLNIEMRVTHRIPHLFKGPPCCKHGKGAGKRYLSRCRQTGCNPNHITLRNPAVDMTFRKHPPENGCFGCLRQIGVKHHQILMCFTQFRQGIAVAFPGRNFLIFHLRSPPSRLLRQTASLLFFLPLPASRQSP